MMIITLLILVIAISIISLSTAYQVLIYNRAFLSSRGWIRITIHNFGIELMIALAVVLALMGQGGLEEYWHLILLILGGRILGDLPLVISKESQRRHLVHRNNEIVRKYLNG